jgi:hypothetical protein
MATRVVTVNDIVDGHVWSGSEVFRLDRSQRLVTPTPWTTRPVDDNWVTACCLAHELPLSTRSTSRTVSTTPSRTASNCCDDDLRRGMSRGTNHRPQQDTTDTTGNVKALVGHPEPIGTSRLTGLRRRERRFESCPRFGPARARSCAGWCPPRDSALRTVILRRLVPSPRFGPAHRDLAQVGALPEIRPCAP